MYQKLFFIINIKVIKNNPYRIAGLLSNSSEREITKQKSKISKFASVGKEIKSEYDFTFLEIVNRSAENVEKAFSKIEQSQGKVNYSLFWFLKINSFDETALNHLIGGNKEKAEEIWNKVTNGKEITKKNYSCFNNLGSMFFVSDDKKQIQKGIELKLKLIESSLFKDFVLSVSDETFSINNKKQVEIFIDEVLANLNDKINEVDTQKLFKNCGKNTTKYLASKFTDGPIQEIETKIQSIKRKRNDSKDNLYELGSQLFKDCEPSLKSLKQVLGEKDLKYKMIIDNLAKEVMQCGIDFFNEFKDTEDPSEKSLKLIELAKSIALGKSTLERINDNYDAINEWSESAQDNKDINYISEKLKAFKGRSIEEANRLIEFCKPALIRLRLSLGATDDFYIKISSALVSRAMTTIIEVSNKDMEILEESNNFYNF